MRRNDPSRTGRTPSPMPTTRELVVAYLLIPVIPVVLWAASEPILAATLVAGAVATVALQAVLVAVSVGGGHRRNRVCIPLTGVCVEY